MILIYRIDFKIAIVLYGLEFCFVSFLEKIGGKWYFKVLKMKLPYPEVPIKSSKPSSVLFIRRCLKTKMYRGSISLLLQLLIIRSFTVDEKFWKKPPPPLCLLSNITIFHFDNKKERIFPTLHTLRHSKNRKDRIETRPISLFEPCRIRNLDRNITKYLLAALAKNHLEKPSLEITLRIELFKRAYCQKERERERVFLPQQYFPSSTGSGWKHSDKRKKTADRKRCGAEKERGRDEEQKALGNLQKENSLGGWGELGWWFLIVWKEWRRRLVQFHGMH